VEGFGRGDGGVLYREGQILMRWGVFGTSRGIGQGEEIRPPFSLSVRAYYLISTELSRGQFEVAFLKSINQALYWAQSSRRQTPTSSRTVEVG